jgi:hypothetical protein
MISPQVARNHDRRSEGRCIPRFQVYRMSTQIPRPRDWFAV